MQVLDAARYAIVQQTRKYDWLSAELAEAKQDVRDARLDEDDEDAVAEAKAEVARLKAEGTSSLATSECTGYQKSFILF